MDHVFQTSALELKTFQSAASGGQTDDSDALIVPEILLTCVVYVNRLCF